MPDFNKVLQPGDYQNGTVNTVVEIPMGSTMKIEWDRNHAAFVLDRVEPQIFPKPTNYGFIPQTLDEDGDELDTLIITESPLTTGVWLEAHIIGILNFQDEKGMDHKVICVPADERNTGDAIKSLDDLSPRLKEKIEYHFAHYKDLYQPGATKVLGWGDTEAAKQTIAECIERFKKG
ncbi:TPA: inorganic pyrophosphatase [Candidatus Saccharibacteria bacterium]|nr:MAG: Inorganic pyrophosphatase [Candidatus Saccharibacteria bacterium GW2011_GWA2_46_10]OGL35015.1 MAG: inorganic pyrophosphatase [Candidatus Saccharibacteria bacterium RIFCSPHIGHO2_12_FULL_47_17]HCM51905.1 inorganic pyrophosphatase [Candidatus Saccharibacteria bacterium]